MITEKSKKHIKFNCKNVGGLFPLSFFLYLKCLTNLNVKMSDNFITDIFHLSLIKLYIKILDKNVRSVVSYNQFKDRE